MRHVLCKYIQFIYTVHQIEQTSTIEPEGRDPHFTLSRLDAFGVKGAAIPHPISPLVHWFN